MSLADWVCALAPCFDPEREGAGGVPPALSRFLQRRKAAALPPAGQSQTFAEAASPPSGDFASAIHSLTATLGKSKALAPQKAGPPPALGKVSRRAFQMIQQNGAAVRQISTSSPIELAYALGNGLALASVPPDLHRPDAPLFSTSPAGTLQFSVPIPDRAEPLEVRDTLRVLLLARRPAREQIISSGSLFPAFANRFPEVLAQLLLHRLYPGLHTEESLRKLIRNSHLVQIADTIARGEFSDCNILHFARSVAQVANDHFFLPGDTSLPLASCGHTEMITLDPHSQALVNRAVDAFLFHAIGKPRAFSGWWNRAGKFLLVCLLAVPAAHLYDAPLNPEALAKISFELRQILARVSEAVRQLSANFDLLDFTALLGEEASNLLAVAKQCAEGLGSAVDVGGGSTYDKIPESSADDYYQQCLRAASWSTPKGKRGAPATPTRPGKLSKTEGQQSCDPSEAEPYGGSAKSWRPHHDSSEIGETSSGDGSEPASRSSKSKGESDAAEEVVSFHTQGTPLTFHDGSGRPRLLTLSQLLDQDPEFLENSHDYMQALFPLDVESRAVPLSPVLSARQIKNLPSDTILEAEDFMRSLLEDQHESGNLGSHHYRRITRILKCLALCGLSQEASDFRDFAVELTGATRIANQYWDPAIEEADPDPEG